jgi:hypothetical protein
VRADQRERQVRLGRELLKHGANSVLAADREAVRVGTTEQHRVRAERKPFDDVRASADSAVDKHRHIDRLSHLDERVERCNRAVDLTAAMVRHDDAVDSCGDGTLRILSPEHTLHEQRQRGLLAQPREVVPGQVQVGKRRQHRRGRGERVVSRSLLETAAEDRIAEELRATLTAEKREVRVA